MADTQQILNELREAERHLTLALRAAGMARGRRGFIAPPIAAALQDVREAASGLDVPPARRRSWARLARTT